MNKTPLMRAAASVASVIGQTSPQLLNPNASNTTLPRNRAIENGLPSEPLSASSGAGMTGDSVPALKRSSGGERRGGAAAATPIPSSNGRANRASFTFTAGWARPSRP